MNRFDRIVSILIQLQHKRVVTAQEIAKRFDVSLRTIYRDIRSLEESGVPIISEAGIGYSIMEGYRLPPVMFTKEEAITFITAEKLMNRYTDYSLNAEYQSAMFKIRSVLRNADKSFLEKVEDRIAVIKRSNRPDRSISSQQLIISCIGSRSQLFIEYRAEHSQEVTNRNIEPIGMFHIGESWHVIAYCHLREDYRDFRLDRLINARLTNDPFKMEHPPLTHFLEKFDTKRELKEVVFKIPKPQYRFLSEQKFYMGFVSQQVTKDHVELRFLTSSLEGFARWLMMFADAIEISKPAELKSRMKEILGAISKKF